MSSYITNTGNVNATINSVGNSNPSKFQVTVFQAGGWIPATLPYTLLPGQHLEIQVKSADGSFTSRPMKTSNTYCILISFACAIFIGQRQASAQTSTQNFIWSRRALVPIAGDLTTVNDKTQVNESVQYFDDLGRPLQTVDKQSTPLGNDLVSFFFYDQYGRKVRSYLPYPSAESTGSLKNDPISDQQSFYETHAGTV